MAQLIVRNIDQSIVTALRAKAARHGRSAEAEHREILRVALLARPVKDLRQHLLDMPDVGHDGDFRIQRRKARRVQL